MGAGENIKKINFSNARPNHCRCSLGCNLPVEDLFSIPFGNKLAGAD
jgi:hypothetical protein